MKKRRFPYGYEMKNGIVSICPLEADILRQIFADYIGGAFLKTIADRLTDEKVEYLPGESNWNKNRIQRIIEDKRYTGNDNYASIIDETTFLKANSIKDSRRTHVVGTVNAVNRPLIKAACCGRCGAKLSHKANLAKQNSEYWYCQNKDCGISFKMTLTELEETVTQILNRLIDNPMLSYYFAIKMYKKFDLYAIMCLGDEIWLPDTNLAKMRSRKLNKLVKKIRTNVWKHV